MKYSIEMGSVTVIYIQSFKKNCLGIQKFIGEDTKTHRQHGDLISLLLFFSEVRKVG
jgi:hypothetical protein